VEITRASLVRTQRADWATPLRHVLCRGQRRSQLGSPDRRGHRPGRYVGAPRCKGARWDRPERYL